MNRMGNRGTGNEGNQGEHEGAAAVPPAVGVPGPGHTPDHSAQKDVAPKDPHTSDCDGLSPRRNRDPYMKHLNIATCKWWVQPLFWC